MLKLLIIWVLIIWVTTDDRSGSSGIKGISGAADVISTIVQSTNDFTCHYNVFIVLLVEVLSDVVYVN